MLFSTYLRKLRSGLAAMIVAAMPFFGVLDARADAPRPAIFLLDGSGSMWGKLPGDTRAKFQVVRDGLRDWLVKREEESGVGLVSFRGSCTGSSINFVPPTAKKDAIANAIGGLNPKGKGPITVGLQRAVELLEPGRPGSIVLVHDGLDNCRRDPCAIGEALAETHPDVRIHLVSIGLNEKQSAAISCLPRATRGTTYSVTTGDALVKAVNLVTELVTNGSAAKKPGAAPEPNLSGAGPDAQPPPIAPEGPPHLQLLATLGQDGPRVKTPVRWRVLESGEDKIPVLDVVEPQLQVPLKQGTYVVQAELGWSKLTQEVTLAPKGPTALTAVFDAGLLKIQAGPQSASGDARKFVASLPIMLTIRSLSDSGSDKAASLKPIILSAGAESQIVLPAGDYLIDSEFGHSRSQHKVSVKTGSEQTLAIDSTMGVLGLSAAIAGDKVRETDRLFVVEVDDPDSAGGLKEVARSAALQPSFVLPAGTYSVSVRVGAAKGDARIALGTGDIKNVRINVEIATLRVVTAQSLSSSQRDLQVTYRVRQLPDANTDFVTSLLPSPGFKLPPGKYRVIAEIGPRNVKASADITLASSDDRTVSLTPDAAQIRLQLSGQSNNQAVDRFWEIRDGRQNVIWRTNQLSPMTLLAPGDYFIRCQTRHGSATQSVTLAAGDTKTIELDVR